MTLTWLSLVSLGTTRGQLNALTMATNYATSWSAASRSVPRLRRAIPSSWVTGPGNGGVLWRKVSVTFKSHRSSSLDRCIPLQLHQHILFPWADKCFCQTLNSCTVVSKFGEKEVWKCNMELCHHVSVIYHFISFIIPLATGVYWIYWILTTLPAFMCFEHLQK